MTLVRYLASTLLWHMLSVFGVLAGLLWVFTVLDQSTDVGSGRYTLAAAAIYSISMLPYWFSQFASMAAFLGALTGIGRLHQDSEITAMRAAGWSISRIATVAAVTGALVAVAGFLVGETLAPRATIAAVQRKAELRFGPEFSASATGVWTRDQQRIIGFDRRAARSVTVLTLDADGELLAYADASSFREIAPDVFAFADYAESRITPEGIRRSHEANVDQVGAAPALLSLSDEAMRAPTIRQVHTRARELEAAGLEYADLEYEMHDRIARVVVAPALAILAVISVVGPLRSSRRSSRLVLGVVTGFVLSTCRDAAHTMVAVFGFSPAAMAWSPTLLLLVAVVVMARTLRPRSPRAQAALAA